MLKNRENYTKEFLIKIEHLKFCYLAKVKDTTYTSKEIIILLLKKIECSF